MLDQTERAKTAPEAPFERVAARIRSRILVGELPDGSVAPSIKEIAAAYGVAVGTAHRAADLLRLWGMLSPGGRGKRPLILLPDQHPAAAGPPEIEQPPVTGSLTSGSRLLDLELLHLGSPVRTFAAEADPGDPKQLARLLRSAVRRHTAGVATDLSDFELAVRDSADSTMLTVFASL